MIGKSTVALLALAVASASAFVAPTTGPAAGLRMAYVPDGLSADQWAAIKAKETVKSDKLAAVGITRFQSRSMQGWMEGGQQHQFPTDPKKTPVEKRPYMQRGRGASWDDSDLGKKMAKAWTKADKEYKDGGEERAKSISIFGAGHPSLGSRGIAWA